ncbi:carbohydrate ABC transporter permease [Catellatospora vulcania]|uniref:carbohydrate ABC transporter permease n=1 Tax=Catellatospora vulcania TaxID=1460450 RepID=UPI0012D3BD28|nr:carbohydrate ABC transporter permease [Catellatospora vulcania]
MSNAHRPAWMGRPSPLTTAAKAVAITVIVALMVFPMWVVVATSFAPPEEVVANGGFVIWPSEWTSLTYQRIFAAGMVPRALAVSLGVTLVGTALSLALTIGLAYALSRPQVFGGKPVLLMVLFTFLMPAGMIPLFLVVQGTGLLNTFGALFAPLLLNAFNLIVMRGFFQSVPSELIEAARIDGAGELRILLRLVLPLSKAVIAVVGLFYAVSYWNNFFNGVIYLNDSGMWPMATLLRSFTSGGLTVADATGEAGAQIAPVSVQMAVVVLATVPILLVYPFVQRFFVKGVLTGAVKA